MKKIIETQIAATIHRTIRAQDGRDGEPSNLYDLTDLQAFFHSDYFSAASVASQNTLRCVLWMASTDAAGLVTQPSSDPGACEGDCTPGAKYACKAHGGWG